MIKTEREMREMTEMNKAFDDFSKACDNARKACDDFVKMDINKTSEVQESTQKIEDATPLPQVTIVHGWRVPSERQIDMNGDVYIREDEDYLCRD